jgi:CheY-like chemotaxis protein
MVYLIVDDKEENLNAAREWFKDRAEYASSTLKAIEKISSESIDQVISDLEMEHRLSGLDVAYTAGLKAIRTVIATGGIGHGKEYIRIIPRIYDENRRPSEIYGSKNNPEVWKQIEELAKLKTIPIRLIEEGWGPTGKYPWKVLEWVYMGDLGFYEPSEEIKELAKSKMII